MELSGADEVNCKKAFVLARDRLKAGITPAFYVKHRAQFDMFRRRIVLTILILEKLEEESGDDLDPMEELLADEVVRLGWLFLMRAFETTFTPDVYEAVHSMKQDGLFQGPALTTSDLRFALLCKTNRRLELALQSANKSKEELESLKKEYLETKESKDKWEKFLDTEDNGLYGKCYNIPISMILKL